MSSHPGPPDLLEGETAEVSPAPMGVLLSPGGDLWSPPPHERAVRWGLFGFFCLLFLPYLGSFGLWDPWETHYGAVTTQMVETYDWVSPWWGYKEKIGTEPVQGNHFFSKPVFTFWSEAFFCRILGRGELAIRLPMALLAILAAFLTYLVISRVFSRPAGLLASLVMATSPQYYMISRQAQTDMPFVGTLTMGLMFLMLALFGPRQIRGPRALGTWLAGTVAVILLSTVPQYFIIAADLSAPIPGDVSGLEALTWPLAHIRHTGWLHGVLFGLLLLGLIGWWSLELRRDQQQGMGRDDLFDKWRRRCLLALFYVMIAHSTYAKGLLGFALPGLIISVYLLMTGQLRWRALKALDVVRGSLLCVVVGLPWYLAMFAKHGYAYYQRFFIHDHFKRLASGVHQVDSGNFEHYIKWLGIGTFPWVAFVPLALAWALRQRVRDPDLRGQARLFVILWFTLAFTLFTLSSTKFHHYIFPALPALAVLVGLYLTELRLDRGWHGRLAALVGLVLLATVGRDLHQDQQHIRNLMTYKYDRPLPTDLPIDREARVTPKSEVTWGESTFFRHTPTGLQNILTTAAFEYHRWILTITVLGLICLSLFFVAKTRTAALVALGLCATAMTLWSLNYYMPSLTPHWSQKYLFDSYYDTCEVLENPPEVDEAYRPVLADLGLPGLARSLGWENKVVCQEDVISWLLTWRGETYYSYNELQPIQKEAPQFLPYLEDRNHGRAFYVLMERGKEGAFESKLDGYSQKLRRKGTEGWADIEDWTVEVIHQENHYFQMVRAIPVIARAEEETEDSGS